MSDDQGARLPGDVAPLPPAGWYPDPERPSQHRYWNGTAWAGPGGRLPGGPSPQPSGRPLTSTWAALSMFTLVAIGAVAITEVVATANGFRAAEVISGWVSDPSSVDAAVGEQIDGQLTTTAYIELGLAVVAAVLFLVWLRLLRSSDVVAQWSMRHRPGWAVGAWFVPVLWFWRPVQIIADMGRGLSRPPIRAGQQKSSPAPMLVRVWWATFIVSTVLERISNDMIGQSDTLPKLGDAYSFSGYANLVTAIAALLWLLVVRSLWQRARVLDPAPAS